MHGETKDAISQVFPYATREDVIVTSSRFNPLSVVFGSHVYRRYFDVYNGDV